ncbi:nucleoside triphosphate pyrophosphohydrolase family protein [Fibrella sp. HMF5405]|uniref:Nucleoside triphosphate pyrophosphohydrolase family protein n=2 Tax=Fibrella forsythiae TaxID=2817061 RepID=A0ABS3JBI4_9BACT|nr:nucleoside triphosphate pyrophosphohydrolase family protein [Fibrella forsythiae]
MTDNLRGVLDVWEAQYQGTLAEPGRQYVPHPVDYLALVKQFHHTFQSPVLDAPQIPAADRCALRINLLEEELEELVTAIRVRDLVGIADALCDLQYVLSGAVLEFGLAEKFGALFCEVHRSNMSKACLTEEEAIATVALFAGKGETSTYKEVDGVYLVFRDGDRKTLKGINYSPADLEAILVTAPVDQP